MGKGSSKGHTPREAKDNLKSTQLLSVIDAISEGPVEGPVDGLKSVLLNSTPVPSQVAYSRLSWEQPPLPDHSLPPEPPLQHGGQPLGPVV